MTDKAPQVGQPTQGIPESQAANLARQRVSREILEDRLDGLLADGPQADSRLHLRLHRVIQALYEGISRVAWTGDLRQADGRPGDGQVTDDVERMIGEMLISKVDELGLAR